MNTTIINKTIQLNDGRILGYTEFGNPESTPIFHFHAWPGSRLETKLIHYLFKEHQESGVRLIGIDRPGIGLSTFKTGRKILDWPNDVSEFADKLGIDRFCVQGISGGGPYAAACAFKIPDRLISCCIISGISPLYFGTEGMNISNRFVFFIAKWFPWLLRLFLWASIGRYSQFLEKVDALIARSLSKLPEPDRALLSKPDIRKIFAEVTCEAFLQGSKGPAYEGRLYSLPWGFKLDEIKFDKIYLYHGELDTNVPFTNAKLMADSIPKCKTKFFKNDSHLSVGFNNYEEIKKSILNNLSS